MGVVLGQTAVAGVDDCVAGLAFGAIEGRFDRLVAGSPIEALELDRYTVDASVGRAPAGAKPSDTETTAGPLSARYSAILRSAGENLLARSSITPRPQRSTSPRRSGASHSTRSAAGRVAIIAPKLMTSWLFAEVMVSKYSCRLRVSASAGFGTRESAGLPAGRCSVGRSGFSSGRSERPSALTFPSSYRGCSRWATRPRPAGDGAVAVEDGHPGSGRNHVTAAV
jgi:hypothetical protein